MQKLNLANDYYEIAKNDLNSGNVEAFNLYVTNYVDLLRNIDDNLDMNIRNMEIEINNKLYRSLFLSILYVILGYVIWKFLIRNYKNRILKLKPLVSNNEFE